MIKQICKECSSNDWEEIISNFIHDEAKITLFQCKNCKRVVAFDDPDENVYECKNYTVLNTTEV